MLGGSWTLVGIGIMGLLSEGIPAEDTLSYNRMFTQVVGLSTFLGPILGHVLLSSGLTLVVVLITGALLRVVAGWFIRG